MDLSELMKGHNLSAGNAATAGAAVVPPAAVVNAAPAPAAVKAAPAPVAPVMNAPVASVAVPPSAPKPASNAIVPPNYPDYSAIASVPPNYPPYPGMVRNDAQAPAAAPSPIVAPKPFVNAAPVMSKDLIRARNWVAQKKLDYAAIAYRKHVAAYPNDANGYGELGNVYLLSKRYSEAAQSYYEAANRLLDVGYVDVVMPLMPVIMQYQPVLGSRLKAKMTFMGKQND
jgi:TolA-binding protein